MLCTVSLTDPNTDGTACQSWMFTVLYRHRHRPDFHRARHHRRRRPHRRIQPPLHLHADEGATPTVQRLQNQALVNLVPAYQSEGRRRRPHDDRETGRV